jgi:nucleoside-diphosphate-sugar epimerase
VYGPSESCLGEDAALLPESAYGASKLIAERIHAAWQEEMPERRRLTMVRPAVVFGHGEAGNFTRLATLLRRGMFVYPGRTDTRKACIYVGELIETLLFADRAPDSSLIYNACYPTPSTIREICDSICGVMGYRRPRLVAPYSALLLAGRVGEAVPLLRRSGVHRDRVEKLNRSTAVAPDRLCQMGYHWHTDLEGGLDDWRSQSPDGRLE